MSDYSLKQMINDLRQMAPEGVYADTTEGKRYRLKGATLHRDGTFTAYAISGVKIPQAEIIRIVDAVLGVEDNLWVSNQHSDIILDDATAELDDRPSNAWTCPACGITSYYREPTRPWETCPACNGSGVAVL